MSMPTFPSDANIPTREEAINQILSSIAMEELGLSHILNAEGEKLQYILGTLEGITGPGATIDDVLDVNESVQEMLQTAAHNQMFLRRKMKDALNASVMQGPTGAMGPSGTAAAQPFVSGTSYLAGDLILYYDQVYVVNVESPTGTPGSSIDYTLLSASDEGITGPTGATGPGFNTYGSFVSFSSSTYAGGTPSTPVILPLAQATATVNPSSAFTLNLDGSI
ncbi:MAG: collagen-like protein, partial [Defluviitaleaceae bacterium]|nr:collagen-like protein [Defluviitaleaceae bacterium]